MSVTLTYSYIGNLPEPLCAGFVAILILIPVWLFPRAEKPRRLAGDKITLKTPQNIRRKIIPFSEYEVTCGSYEKYTISLLIEMFLYRPIKK